MTRFLKASLTLAAAAALLASPALAGQAVTLKAEPMDADGVVTLDDLFDGAGAAGKVAVASKPGASVVLDAGAVQASARRAGLEWANTQGLRRIVVRAGAVGATASKGNVEVLTYARNLNAGETVRPEDLVWAKFAAAPMDAPRDVDAVIGMTARRPLREGGVVSTRDVAAPQVIKAGDMVNVAYQDGAITVSLTGKAIAAATLGETVGIENPSSRKVISAIATGPGQALVGPGASQFRTRQYAAR